MTMTSSSNLSIEFYGPEMADEWNALVARSRNGTFLLDRRFMDYHQARFRDCSAVFRKRGRMVACFPANFSTAENTVYSHQGLTYGGLICEAQITATEVLHIYALLLEAYRQTLHADRLIVKPVPYIYNRYMADEQLYALFRSGATLTACGISSAIPLQHRLPLRESRKSGIRKANALGLSVSETQRSDDLHTYSDLLRSTLETSHHVRPVHSVEDMELLMSRFPDNIRLYLCRHPQGRILAGTWIFDCGTVVHTQYLAASAEGKQSGALDLLLHHLITTRYADRTYFDFGISTEQGGHFLNEGLIFQKEGFGGRGVCYDTWEITIHDTHGRKTEETT